MVLVSYLYLYTLGTVLTATGVGAAAGIALIIIGGALGAPGGFVIGVAYILEALYKDSRIMKVTKILNKDRFQCIRIAVLIARARREDEVAGHIGITPDDAAKIFSVTARLVVHIFPAVTNGRSIAYGITRAASAGLNIAGAVASGFMIPVDIAQFIASAYSIHKRNKSGVINEIERLAESMETASWSTLRSLGFHVVFLQKYTVVKTVACTVLAVTEETIDSDLNLMQQDPLGYEETCYEESSDKRLVLYESQEMPNRFYYERVFQIWERRKINFVRLPLIVSSD